MNDDFNKTAWESLLFNLDVTMQTQWVMLFNAPVVITYMYKHYIFPYVVIEWNFLLFFLVTLLSLVFYQQIIYWQLV